MFEQKDLINLLLTITVPLSDTPDPDILSANSLSLSGSVRIRPASALFFKMDLFRL